MRGGSPRARVCVCVCVCVLQSAGTDIIHSQVGHSTAGIGRGLVMRARRRLNVYNITVRQAFTKLNDSANGHWRRERHSNAIRYDTIRDAILNVRSKANMSQLNLPHGNDN